MKPTLYQQLHKVDARRKALYKGIEKKIDDDLVMQEVWGEKKKGFEREERGLILSCQNNQYMTGRLERRWRLENVAELLYAPYSGITFILPKEKDLEYNQEVYAVGELFSTRHLLTRGNWAFDNLVTTGLTLGTGFFMGAMAVYGAIMGVDVVLSDLLGTIEVAGDSAVAALILAGMGGGASNCKRMHDIFKEKHPIEQAKFIDGRIDELF